MILEDVDVFNNQFTLLYYLKKNNIDMSIIEFLKNNNIYLNDIGFIHDYSNGQHIIITTNMDNIYKIITIGESDKENSITDYRKYNLNNLWVLDIHYNGINIKVSKTFSIKQLETIVIVKDTFLTPDSTLRLKFLLDYYNSSKPIERTSNTYDSALTYLKNTNASNITKVKNAISGQIFCMLGPLQYISFHSLYNANLEEDMFLPSFNTLKELYFGRKFNKIIKPGIIPESCTALIFGDDYNQIFEELPQSLEVLAFGYSYNQVLDPDLLPSLRILAFGNNYNVKTELPKSIVQVYFGYGFQQILEPKMFNRCLNSLEILKFSHNYSASIPNNIFDPIISLKRTFYTKI